MPDDAWMRCSACKTDIFFGMRHWVCSVSTCNRNRMRLVFCSIACWDSHLADARHRDAGAVEARAPSRLEWEREQEKERAESPTPSAPVAPAVRKIVGAAAPTSAPAVTGTMALSSNVDRDVLIVVSKLKKYIKDRSGMNTSDSVADALSDCVRAICDDAIRTAAQDDRKTVLDRDVPKPLRR